MSKTALIGYIGICSRANPKGGEESTFRLQLVATEQVAYQAIRCFVPGRRTPRIRRQETCQYSRLLELDPVSLHEFSRSYKDPGCIGFRGPGLVVFQRYTTSIWVTRSTSSMVVIPLMTLSTPSIRRVLCPRSVATFLMVAAPFRSMIWARTTSSIGSIS